MRADVPPLDTVEDRDLPHWAGLLALSTAAGAPEPALDLPVDIDVPAHVEHRARPVLS